MTLSLDKVDPEFRNLTDLLCFSNRNDLDLSKYKSLLKSNYTIHYNYLWNRFLLSTAIFWIDDYWENRLAFYFSLNDKKLITNISFQLEKSFMHLFHYKNDLDPIYDLEYHQYIKLCKIKYLRKETIPNIRGLLLTLPSRTEFSKITKIVNNFVPYVFSSFDEYVSAISDKITESSRNYSFLLYLESNGLLLNREKFVPIFNKIIFDVGKTIISAKQFNIFFSLLNDQYFTQLIKLNYTDTYRSKLQKFITKCPIKKLDENHFINIKNLISLDPNLSDFVFEAYADKLYKTHIFPKKINRLVCLIKEIPNASPKQILLYLSINNKMSDIRHLLSIYPDLNKLITLV